MNPKNLRENPVLTNMSLGYSTEGVNLVADKIYPNVYTPKRSGKIVSYTPDNLRLESTKVAHNSPSPEVILKVSSTDHFDIEEHRIKEFVSSKEIEEADKPIDPKVDATLNVTDKLKLGVEKLAKDSATNPSVVTQGVTLTGTAQWSDSANATPSKDVREAVRKIKSTTGTIANTVVMSWEAMDYLLDTAEVKAFFPGAALVTRDLVKSKASLILGVENIEVADAVFNSAKEGQDDVLESVWGSDVFVGYVEKTPRLKSRSFGKTYRPSKNKSRKVKEWTTEDPEGVYIRAEEEFDKKIVDSNCAYIIRDVY